MNENDNALAAVITGIVAIQLDLLLELSKEGGAINRADFANRVEEIAKMLSNESAARIIGHLATALREKP